MVQLPNTWRYSRPFLGSYCTTMQKICAYIYMYMYLVLVTEVLVIPWWLARLSSGTRFFVFRFPGPYCITIKPQQHVLSPGVTEQPCHTAIMVFGTTSYHIWVLRELDPQGHRGCTLPLHQSPPRIEGCPQMLDKVEPSAPKHLNPTLGPKACTSARPQVTFKRTHIPAN